MLSLYLLAVNKGGFGLSKNGFSFFIHWLCHFLWAVKVFDVIFWPFYLVKKSIKTLDARKKWHSHHMKKPNPFLEGSNLLLLTAKRYKYSINYRLWNHTDEILMFTPKNTGCSNHYDLKCKYRIFMKLEIQWLIFIDLQKFGYLLWQCWSSF